MPVRRSLADELADLVNPAPQPELDPEQGWADAAAGEVDLEEEPALHARPAKRAREKGLLLRGAVSLDEDPTYRGRRTSRAALFGVGGEGGGGDGAGAGAAGGGPWGGAGSSGSDGEDDSEGGSGGDLEGELEGDSEEGGWEEGGEEGGSRGRAVKRGRHGPGATNGVGGGLEEEEEEEEEEEGGSGEEEGEGLESQEEEDEREDGLAGPSGRGAWGRGAAARDGGRARRAADSGLEGGESESSDDDDEEEGSVAGWGEGSEEDEGGEAGPEAAAGRRLLAAAHGAAAAGGGGDEELQELEREYQQVQEEEAQLVRSADPGAGAREVARGRGVMAQQRLWERGLELRILLQKCLAGAHRLPQPPVRARVLRGRPGVAAGHSELVAAAHSTLACLTSLSAALMQRHPEMASRLDSHSTAHAGSKRQAPEADSDAAASPSHPQQSHAQWWDVLQRQWDAFSPFRDASVDRWHRRTRLAAGAVRASLRALDQGVSAQVAAVLAGPASKRARRVHLPASAAPRLLCHPEQPSPQQAPGANGTAAAGSGHADEEGGGAGEWAVDTYDDGEFYQQLLKELLESSSGGGLSHAAVRAVKKRKLVDRRASKGRKIRYQVHEKLVNFAAPVEAAVPPFAEHLFANLFGHGGR